MTDEQSIDYLKDADLTTGGSVCRKRIRKKVSVEWNEASVMKLIAAVQARDYLWNANHKNHKCRILRDAAWKEMSKTVFNGQHDSCQLNAKWANLRIQFKSYYAKAKQQKNSTEAGVSWKHFNQMMFIAADEEYQPYLTWSAQEVHQLIREFENIPLLWKRDHVDYQDQRKRRLLLLQLANKFESNLHDLKVKLRSLRTMYMQNVKKSNQDDRFKPRWEFYESLHFLNNELGSARVIRKKKKLPSEVKASLESSDHETTPSSTEVHQQNAPEKTQPIVLKQMNDSDDFQLFGNFVAGELRKIGDPSLAYQVQRKVTRFLMDCMDEVEQSCSRLVISRSSSAKPRQANTGYNQPKVDSTIHAPKILTQTNNPTVPVHRKGPTKTKTHNCPQCEQKFPIIAHLRAHIDHAHHRPGKRKSIETDVDDNFELDSPDQIVDTGTTSMVATSASEVPLEDAWSEEVFIKDEECFDIDDMPVKKEIDGNDYFSDHNL